LLAGACVWGVIWYPYRSLAQAGMSAELAITLTYAGALALCGLWLRPAWRRWRLTVPLLLIALTAGSCNIGFTLSVVHGDVMRVVLLFYLAPLWTVLCARFLLNERLTGQGYVLMTTALAGAAIMLWEPRLGLPVPRSAAEWGGMGAGAMFALSNVLSRKHAGLSIESKTLAVLCGCVFAGGVCLLFQPASLSSASWGVQTAALVLLLAVVLFSVNVAVQHGLALVSAHQAIVIYLVELVVTALSAWLFAGETLAWNEWCGGFLIIAAGAWSGHLSSANADTLAKPDALTQR
jgi:drug/metabolite transporter (DMT)-like permease